MPSHTEQIACLVENLQLLLGDGAVKEAEKRLSEALSTGRKSEVSFWFDVWAELARPIKRL